MAFAHIPLDSFHLSLVSFPQIFKTTRRTSLKCPTLKNWRYIEITKTCDWLLCRKVVQYVRSAMVFFKNTVTKDTHAEKHKLFANRRPSSVPPLYAVGASLLTVAPSWTGGCNAVERLTSWNTLSKDIEALVLAFRSCRAGGSCLASASSHSSVCVRLSLLLSH